METSPNKYITVAYELYTTEDGKRDLVEKATNEHPFQFITGLGTTLDTFENQLKDLKSGDKFEFTIPFDQAYGEYNDEHVLDLPKNIFEIDGKFDADRMNGTVVEVKDEIVVMDLHHPLAGDDLTFVGEVIESRPATNEEIQGTLNMMSGGGCSCCEGGCEDGHDKEEGCCGGGHCH